MNYGHAELLGATKLPTPPSVDTSKKNRTAAAGAVSSGFEAAGNVLSSFFKYKTEQSKASRTDPNRTAYDSGATKSSGMSRDTKTMLMVGGGVAALAVVALIVAR